MTVFNWDEMRPGYHYHWPILRGNALYISYFMVNYSSDGPTYYHFKADFGTSVHNGPGPTQFSVPIVLDPDNRIILKQSAPGLTAGIPGEATVKLTFLPMWVPSSVRNGYWPRVDLDCQGVSRTSLWTGPSFPRLAQEGPKAPDIEAFIELAKDITSPRGRSRYR